MIFTTVEPKSYLKLRILATLIDLSIFTLLAFVYLFVFGDAADDGTIKVTGVLTLPVFLLWIFYFPGTEALNQATPGHDICKLTVVHINGSRVSFSTAFKRRICDFVDLGMYALPAIICILKTQKYQRLGDLLAGTLVVKKADIIKKEVTF